jgi:short-subunit dehydrogenase
MGLFSRAKPPESRYKPVVLVTGCGSGIGLALAKLLYAQERYRVVITAREKTVPKLKEIFKETDRFIIRSLDVTSEYEREALVFELRNLWGSVDVLINNAGISYRSVIEHMTEKDENLQIATNYLGPMGLIRLVLPYMRKRSRGKIINISSVSGMLAMPTMGAYSASKYALEGASEALWYETRPFGIDVCLIQPGFIHSNSFKNVYYTFYSNPERSFNGPYGDFYRNMTPFVEKLMHLSPTTPERIAEIILKTIRMRNPPLWIPVTLDAWIFYYIRRIFPRRLLLPFLFFCLPNARRWGKSHARRKKA